MTKNKISISVIIPTFNSEKTITDAINSVLSQTSQGSITEIIIVNDGSTDKTASVVKKAIKNNNTKIKIILIEQTNQGVSSARNKGIMSATGNWVALLDSDDKWLPEKIEKQIYEIINYPEINIIGSNRDNLIKKRGIKINDSLYRLNVIHELWSYWPSTPTLIINKTKIINLGLYNDSQTHSEDGDLLLKFASKYGVYYSYDSLVKTANKPAYGHSGLSANNKAMHAGCMSNIKNAYKRADINTIQFIFFSIWEKIKYLRRILVTKHNELGVV